MSDIRINRFKRDLGRRQMLGIFSTLASPLLTELFAETGFDWILIDTEHSPNEPGDVVAQLHAMSATPAEAIVRPAWSDMVLVVLVKRVLDLGVQTLLFPYIQSAEDAARAVAYTRYAPRGVSGSLRAARFGLVPDYFARIEDEICVIVQIETADALDRIEEIAAVEGVDAVFIGPADLAACMGDLGNSQHHDVQSAIDGGFRTLKAIGKPAGCLTNNEAEAKRRVADGIDFVGLANDTMIIIRGSRALLASVRAG